MIVIPRQQMIGRGWFFTLVVSLSLLLFLLSLFLTLHFMQRITVTVMPDLSNKSVESARSVLRVKRLKMEIGGYRFDQRIEVNHILEQTPPAGQNISSNQTVKVIVSRGARTLNVPTLSGMSFAEAAERLESDGLVIGRVTRYYTQEASDEMVVDQYPISGTSAARGTAIHLLVSQGPRPVYYIMPNLNQWLVDDAINLLARIGVEIKEIKREPAEDKPNGTVLEQTPLAGVRIHAGDPAGFVVSMQTTAMSQAARFVRIEFVVPLTSTEVRVKLMLRDDTGLHEVYNAMEKSNAKISIQRTINSEAAKLFIYINGKLFEERTI